MPTSPVTNSGSSSTSDANSSMIRIVRGIGSTAKPGGGDELGMVDGVPVVLDVLGPDRAEQQLAPLQLGVERLQRPFGEVAVEVGAPCRRCAAGRRSP
jgi:hypothetical protein